MLYPNGSTTRPKVSSPFGPRDPSIGISSLHAGADLVGFTVVRAIAPGKVTRAGWMNNAAGQTVTIDHGAGVTSIYMHNAGHYVRVGDRVEAGSIIAEMGSTGNATGRCVHLEIRVHGKAIEPLGYIAARLPSKTPTPPSTTGEDEMFITIKGKAGKRRGGVYFIMGGKATFLGADVGKGFPTLTDEAAITALQKRVTGIG